MLHLSRAKKTFQPKKRFNEEEVQEPLIPASTSKLHLALVGRSDSPNASRNSFKSSFDTRLRQDTGGARRSGELLLADVSRSESSSGRKALSPTQAVSGTAVRVRLASYCVSRQSCGHVDITFRNPFSLQLRSPDRGFHALASVATELLPFTVPFPQIATRIRRCKRGKRFCN